VNYPTYGLRLVPSRVILRMPNTFFLSPFLSFAFLDAGTSPGRVGSKGLEKKREKGNKGRKVEYRKTKRASGVLPTRLLKKERL